MIEKRALVRNLVLSGAVLLAAGCKVIPKGPPVVTPTPPPVEDSGVLPTDRERHRVALLVPLSGSNAGVLITFQSPASPIRGTNTLTPSQAEALLAGALYVSVRTEAYDSGEIRGQITK